MNVEVSDQIWARVLNVAAASVYVLSLYVTPYTRGSRDHIPVIKARLVAISLVTVLLMIVYPTIIEYVFSVDKNAVWQRYGLDFDVIYIAKTLLLVGTLFIGPLVAYILDINAQEPVVSLTGLRNYILGPLTEEFVFRGVLVAVYRAANISPLRTFWEIPAYFGLAHVHHIYETFKAHGLAIAAQATIAHLIMTWVFGLLSGFIYARSNNLWACFVAHAFANLMGPPDLGRPGWYKVLLVVGTVGFAYGVTVF